MMRYWIMTFVLALVSLFAAAQSNRVYIEDFEIVPGTTIKVPVLLTNVDPTRGVQFQVTEPDGLQIEDFELSKYSKAHKMNQFGNLRGQVWVMGMYPSGEVCFEPDTAAVIMMLEITAAPDFKGGDIILWKQRGSTMDSETIYFEDHTTRVDVQHAAP